LEYVVSYRLGDHRRLFLFYLDTTGTREGTMATHEKKRFLKFLVAGWGVMALILGLFVMAAAPVLAQTDNQKIYLPLIFVSPPPPSILFYDNFSKSNSGWRQSSSGDCMALYKDHARAMSLWALTTSPSIGPNKVLCRSV
jgi:hypothetical protein